MATHDPPRTPPRSLVWGALAIAILAVSSGSLLVRLAPQVHPISVSFWRTAGVALILAPMLRRISPSDVRLVALAGLLLAAHFATWIASLHLTTVLRSTVLVTLAPVWAGLLEWGVFGRPPPIRFWMGIAVALVGVVVIVGGGSGGAANQGDGLALVGGVLGAAYLVVGRSVRQRVDIGSYGAWVSGAAAVWLLGATLVQGVPLVGFSVQEWGVLAALAVLPQLIGHGGLNYVVRYLPTAVVTAALLLEPVGATILASVFLLEFPVLREVMAGIVILVGVLVATAWRGPQ